VPCPSRGRWPAHCREPGQQMVTRRPSMAIRIGRALHSGQSPRMGARRGPSSRGKIRARSRRDRAAYRRPGRPRAVAKDPGLAALSRAGLRNCGDSGRSPVRHGGQSAAEITAGHLPWPAESSRKWCREAAFRLPGNASWSDMRAIKTDCRGHACLARYTGVLVRRIMTPEAAADQNGGVCRPGNPVRPGGRRVPPGTCAGPRRLPSRRSRPGTWWR